MADGPRFSLQNVSDRLEIDDLLSRYTFAIDAKDFDALDTVFTHFTGTGLEEGGSYRDVARTRRTARRLG